MKVISLVLLAGILAFAAWLRATTFMGAVGPDNFAYVNVADSVLRGTHLYATPEFHAYHIGRLAMLLPLAASFAAFGPGERISTLWPTLCSLGSVCVAFGLGRRLAGPVAGLAAAAFVAAYPLEVLYSTTPLPDTVLPFFLGLSVWAFLIGLDRTGRPAGLAFLASGVALGIAYYARVNALVLFVFFGLWLLWVRRRPSAAMLALPLGAALVLALGTLFVMSRGGPPWFEIAHSIRLSAGHAGMLAARGGRDPLFHFAGMLAFGKLFQPWTVLVALAALVLCLRRDRRLVLPALWALVMYAYFEVGSQYPSASLVQKEMRYLTPLILPMALVLGLAAQHLWLLGRDWPVRTAGSLAMVALVALFVGPAQAAAASFAGQQRGLEAYPPREAAAALREFPPLPVYVTSDWLGYLNFFGRFTYGLDTADPETFGAARLKKAQLDREARPVGVGRGYVVHDETYGLAVPPTWVLVGRAPPRTAIYYAPDPALPEPGDFEMRFGLSREVVPGLSLVAFGRPRAGGAGVAVDWLHAGAALPEVRSFVGPRSLPAELWRSGGIYREYYDVDPVPLGAADPPGGARLEAESFASVLPDQDAALLALVGWGSYSQPPYSGRKAAIARRVGAAASARVERASRVWLRVFSYGPAVNRLEVELAGRAHQVVYRSGAPGLGWVEVPASGAGELTLRVAELGQPFAIVDVVAVEP